DVHAGTVRRKVDTVGQFNAADDLYNFIGRGVDDVNGVRGAIGNVDARGGLRHAGSRGAFLRAAHPCGEGEAVRIVLGSKLAATGVEGGAASFSGEGVKQERAPVSATG